MFNICNGVLLVTQYSCSLSPVQYFLVSQTVAVVLQCWCREAQISWTSYQLIICTLYISLKTNRFNARNYLFYGSVLADKS